MEPRAESNDCPLAGRSGNGKKEDQFKISMTDPALTFTMTSSIHGAVTPESEGINTPLS